MINKIYSEDWFGREISDYTFDPSDLGKGIIRVPNHKYSSFLYNEDRAERICLSPNLLYKEMTDMTRSMGLKGIKVKFSSKIATACTDGRYIKIGIGDKYENISDCYEKLDRVIGMTIHEACHCLYTDFGYMKRMMGSYNSIIHHIHNLIEDEMIERKLCASYPGYENFLNKLKYNVFEKEAEKYDMKANDVDKIFSLLFYIIRYPKFIPVIEEEFLEKYKETFKEIKKIMKHYNCFNIDNANITQSSISAAIDIYELLKDLIENMNNEAGEENNSEEENNSNEESDESEDNESGSDEDESEEDDSEDEDEDDSEDDSEDGEEDDSEDEEENESEEEEENDSEDEESDESDEESDESEEDETEEDEENESETESEEDGDNESDETIEGEEGSDNGGSSSEDESEENAGGESSESSNENSEGTSEEENESEGDDEDKRVNVIVKDDEEEPMDPADASIFKIMDDILEQISSESELGDIKEMVVYHKDIEETDMEDTWTFDELQKAFIRNPDINPWDKEDRSRYNELKHTIDKFIKSAEKLIVPNRKNVEIKNSRFNRNGSLDPTRLANAMCNEQTVYIRKTAEYKDNSPEYALVIMLDESGSMEYSNLNCLASQLAIMLYEAMVKYPKIKIFVYGHGDTVYNYINITDNKSRYTLGNRRSQCDQDELTSYTKIINDVKSQTNLPIICFNITDSCYFADERKLANFVYDLKTDKNQPAYINLICLGHNNNVNTSVKKWNDVIYGEGNWVLYEESYVTNKLNDTIKQIANIIHRTNRLK